MKLTDAMRKAADAAFEAACVEIRREYADAELGYERAVRKLISLGFTEAEADRYLAGKTDH